MKVAATCFTVLIVGAAVVSSCTTIQYEGDNRAPTAKVDVYNSAKEVTRPFAVLGQIKASAQANRVHESRMRERIVEEARKRGAEGVIFLSTEVGLVVNHDYFEESQMRDRRAEFSGPDYDRVRIVKAELIAYK